MSWGDSKRGNEGEEFSTVPLDDSAGQINGSTGFNYIKWGLTEWFLIEKCPTGMVWINVLYG